MTTPVPTWTWPEERLQALMNRARAGRALRPATWPSGARCAVTLSFDSDHDTFELRDGGRSISALSQGHFGARQGVPRTCIGIRKGEPELQAILNKALAEMSADGTLKAISEKWFKMDLSPPV